MQVDALATTEYCDSVDSRPRKCQVEYESFFNHEIQRECELASGNYLEAFYTAMCRHQDGTILTFIASNEPHCIGMSCDGDEGAKLVQGQIDESLYHRFDQAGYSCQFQYVRAVQFESIWRRKTNLPTSIPTLMPSPNPTPGIITAMAPTVSPSKSPVSPTLAEITSNPAVTAANDKFFHKQQLSLSREKDTTKNGWTLVIIILILALAVAVTYQTRSLFSKGNKKHSDLDLTV